MKISNQYSKLQFNTIFSFFFCIQGNKIKVNSSVIYFYLAKRTRRKGLAPIEWAKHFIDLKKDQDGLVIFKIDDVIGMYGFKYSCLQGHFNN